MKTVKTPLIAVVALWLCSSGLSAQDFYYALHGRKIDLNTVPGKYLVEFPAGLPAPAPGAPGSPGPQHPGTRISNQLYLVTDTAGLSGYGVDYSLTPAYSIVDGTEIYVSSKLVLQFKEGVSSVARNNLIAAHNLQFISSTSLYQEYRAENALQTSREIWESGLVKFCHPDFLSRFEPTHQPNDEYFSKQFYLHNTGQVFTDGHSGTSDADIDAPEAWDITKGNSNIIIAIIDEGVTANHPDLPNARQLRLPGSNFAAGYDGSDPDDPSPANNNHGNACAGIAAATQDNNQGISGIAPLCKIMPVRVPFNGVTNGAVYGNAIAFADSNGADIISNSYGGGGSHGVIESAIENAIRRGKIVIFSAGNHTQKPNGHIIYPGSFDATDMITVGASDRYDQKAYYSAVGAKLEIVAPSHRSYPCQDPNETLEVWTVDIPGDEGDNSWHKAASCHTVPGGVGSFLPASGTNYKAYTGRFGGTSAAAPQVAGVAALMRSVNGCLPPALLTDILYHTADKTGGYDYHWNPERPGHSKEMGYGRLNAHKAVVAAQASHSSALDLYMKDRPEDLGYPNSYAFGYWFDNSPDIWARNGRDGLEYQVHEDPEYYSWLNTSNTWVYVRVRNKSCVTSGGNDTLNLYWSMASSGSSWPQNWDGTHPAIGNRIGAEIIPSLAPGESAILEFHWELPQIPNTMAVCLLARIRSDEDLTIEYPADLAGDVYHNNNVAMRNLTVVKKKNKTDYNGMKVPPGRAMLIGNFSSEGDRTYTVRFDLPPGQESTLLEEAEVSVTVEPSFWGMVDNSPGVQFHNIEIINDHTLRISGPEAYIGNLEFPASERIPLYLGYSFYSEQAEEEEKTFFYHVSQHEEVREGAVLTGAVHYKVIKNSRETFEADAGADQEIYTGDAVTLQARTIDEPAAYYWYAPGDSLLGSGTALQLSPAATTQYRLEVIADADGFKDYDEVEVCVKHRWITGMSPNPASQSVTVDYDLEGAPSSANLYLTNSTGTTQHSYPLDITQPQHTVDLASYAPGLYTVGLWCDGTLRETRLLVVQ